MSRLVDDPAPAVARERERVLCCHRLLGFLLGTGQPGSLEVWKAARTLTWKNMSGYPTTLTSLVRGWVAGRLSAGPVTALQPLLDMCDEFEVACGQPDAVRDPP